MVSRKTTSYLPLFGVTLTFLSLGFGCEAQDGTDGPGDDCRGSSCGGAGASSGGRVSSGGSATGGQVVSSGGTAGERNDSAEEAKRAACLKRDPAADFWKDGNGCWVCQHVAELEPQELVFEEPQCFDEGFQLRKVDLGCGYLSASWSGDMGDNYYTIYALTEPSDGLGGAQEPGAGPYTAVLFARGGSSDGYCAYDLYSDLERPSCTEWTTICKGF